MSTQQAEENILYAKFLENLRSAEDLKIFPAVSSGTPVWVRQRGVWRAFLITDRPAPSFDKILASGQVVVTIPAGAQNSNLATVVQNLNISGVQTATSAFASITNGVISASGELVSVQAQLTSLLGGAVLVSASRGPLILHIDPAPALNQVDPLTGFFEWDGFTALATDATANGFGAQLNVAVNWAAIGTTP